MNVRVIAYGPALVLGSQDDGRAFRVKVSFGDEAEYPVTVTDPGMRASRRAWRGISRSI